MAQDTAQAKQRAISVLYRHLAIRSTVFSMLGILSECFWVFLLTSP